MVQTLKFLHFFCDSLQLAQMVADAGSIVHLAHEVHSNDEKVKVSPGPVLNFAFFKYMCKKNTLSLKMLWVSSEQGKIIEREGERKRGREKD